jgi:hypothetical protein
LAIPETQLDTWAKQGAIAGSSTTYNHIKGTLEAKTTPYADKEFSVFLQGSYGNDTNIYAESDVDVVIKLESAFLQDLSELTASSQSAFNTAYSNATYGLREFKRDVLAVLSDAYGNAVNAGTKAIAISAGNGRRKADVIVAMEYRRYLKFNGFWDQDYVEGIIFFTSLGEQIINYPKPHSANLTTKHQATKSWLKPMVRVLKNMRSRLVSENLIDARDAPSYYLEGLLYNVPAKEFGASYGDSFCKSINWLNDTDKTELLCANEQYYLLRNGCHTCWEPAKCDKFLSAAADLWTNW